MMMYHLTKQANKQMKKKKKTVILGTDQFPSSCMPTLDKRLAKKRTKDIA